MGKIKFTTEQFIAEAKKVHGNKFDYSKSEYKGGDKKICIICPEHGEFWQVAKTHINGCGCPKCYGHYKPTTEEFIEKLKKIHGNKYDYSKVQYRSTYEKVCLICPEHGEFFKTPNSLLQGQGCKKCGTKSAQAKNRMTQEEFIKRAVNIHGDKYDYSESVYVNNDTKVKIICPEHGEFWQTPHHHLKGIGCPKCGRKDITENNLFEEIKVKYPDAIHQYSPSILKYKGKSQSLDIFIPSINVGIEYQGRQHFIPISRYGGQKEFEKTTERDKRKYKICKDNSITLLYVSFEKEVPKQYISRIYNNKEDLFSRIEQIKNAKC